MAGSTLTTRRLELRPFAPPDGEALHVLFTDAGVRRWLLDDQVVPREWVEEEIAASAGRFAEGGCGLWALRERLPAARGSPAQGPVPPPRGPIVGFVGFRPFFEPPELQLLYGLLPSRWGLGLATEAARAAVSHAFDALAFPEVRAATDVPNTASIGVLHRLGFVEWRRTEEGTAGTAFFRISVARWRQLVG